MDIQDIRRIVELMNEHGLTHFDLSKKDFHLKLKKGSDADDLRALLAALPTLAAPVPAAAPVAAAGPAPVAGPAGDPAPVAAVVVPAGREITSPMVGTFYRKGAPGAPDLVEVGSTVSIGQTICIIEAMKVMNEIKAEQAGVITAVMVEDGAPVQYGDPLFLLK